MIQSDHTAKQANNLRVARVSNPMIRLTTLLFLTPVLLGALDARAAQELPWSTLVHAPDRHTLDYIPVKGRVPRADGG